MEVRRAGLWVTGSTVLRLTAGLLVVKLIAVYCGPEGLGRLGQLMGVIAILALLAGGGVQNGIAARLPGRLQDGGDGAPVLGAAACIGAWWAIAAALLLLIAAPGMAERLLGDAQLGWALIALALVQPFLAFAALRSGETIGRGESVLFAQLASVAILVGMAGLALATVLGGLTGAALGLIWSAASPGIVHLAWALRTRAKLHRPRWHREEGVHLGRFSLMLLISALSFPLVQIVLRDRLAAHGDWSEVGQWQAVLRISEANLQFVTVMLSSWFLPRVATAVTAPALSRQVAEAYRFVVPMSVCVGLLVWLGGEWVVRLLFSSAFTDAVDLLGWQLAGDCLRALAMVLGFVGMSRGHLGLFAAAEGVQAVSMLTLGWWWIGERGAQGAVQAYFATTAIYLPLCIIVYRIYLGRLAARAG